MGAGFSRSLGGPLLENLLSKASRSRLRAAFPDRQRLDQGPVVYVRQLLTNHGWEGRERSAWEWQHAEEFLEFVDLAASGESQGAQRRLLTLMSLADSPGPRFFVEIAAAAKRLVAAECCAFVKDFEPKYEKCAPYIGWARELQQEDTVITFNYDRVPELAGEAAGRAFDYMLDPGLRTLNGVRLLKLHGSVNWKCDSNTRILAEVPNKNSALDCEHDEIGIGCPGPAKQAFTKLTQVAHLWDLACEAIVEAEVLVFVGYRFPPSDAASRERLLGAVNRRKAVALPIHTVLGPDLDASTRRLQGLLRHSLRNPGGGEREPIIHPLFAEDFLSVVKRSELISL